jgi:hypothetical protein
VKQTSTTTPFIYVVPGGSAVTYQFPLSQQATDWTWSQGFYNYDGVALQTSFIQGDSPANPQPPYEHGVVVLTKQAMYWKTGFGYNVYLASNPMEGLGNGLATSGCPGYN